MLNAVEGVKRKVLWILSKEPKLNKIFSDSMIALLKIRHVNDYIIRSLSVHKAMMMAIECELRKDFEELGEVAFEIMELGNSIASFDDLTADEAKMLHEFFAELNPKKMDSLEVFMSEKLGFKSRKMRDPDSEWSSGFKVLSATMAALRSGSKEDFILEPQRRVEEEEIDNILREYYGSRGYVVEKNDDIISSVIGYMVDKDKESINIAVTNDPQMIIVTVSK